MAERQALRVALAWLVHPVTVVATALLVVNDHLLKAAYPGLLTGKLSDVAGLVMAPPVVATVLALVRPPTRSSSLAAAAIGPVALGFTAVKADPAVAGWASAGWSLVNGPSVVGADRTDLLALPALGLAWVVWRVVRRRPAPGRWLRLLAVLVVLPGAGLAMAATSAPVYPHAVAVGTSGDTIYAGIGNGYYQEPRSVTHYLASTDSGVVFHDVTATERDEAAAAVAQPRTTDCSAATPRHCFRAVPGHLRVEETDDGGTHWQVAWQVSDAERTRLAGSYPGLGDINEYLSSRGLVAQDRAGGGLVVLVANGRDGFARRDTSGHWARIGFGIQANVDSTVTHTPVPIPGTTPGPLLAGLPTPVALAVVGAMAAVFLCCAVAAFRAGTWWPAVAGIGPFFFGALILLAGADVSDSLMRLASWVFGLGLLTTGLLIVSIAVLALRALAARGVPLMLLTGFTTAVAVLAPFLAAEVWSWPSHTLAIWLASAAAAGCAFAGFSVGIRYSRPPGSVPEPF
jgi:hypothetical protein